MNRKAKTMVVVGWLVSGMVVAIFCAVMLYIALSASRNWYPAGLVVTSFCAFLVYWIRRGISIRRMETSPNNRLNPEAQKRRAG